MHHSTTPYQQLRVWQQARQLVRDIYSVTGKYPSSELFGLTSQMRRAAISIMSNIAEGKGRPSSKDFAHFLSNAKSSANEVQAQCIVSNDLGFLDSVSLNKLQTDLNRIIIGMENLVRHLRR